MGAITSVDAAEQFDHVSSARVVSTPSAATSSSDTSSVATSSSEDERQEVQGEGEFSGSAPMRRDASHGATTLFLTFSPPSPRPPPFPVALGATPPASSPVSPGSHAGLPCDAGAGPRAGHATAAEAAPLIPGLPDDLATECLLRLPRQDHRAMRRVSRRWNQLIQSPLYYEMRRHRGVQEGWVYVLSRDSSDRLWWHALDVRSATWHDVPRMPSLCSRAYGLACAACQGNLYVIGGAGWLKPSRPHVYRWVQCRQQDSTVGYVWAVVGRRGSLRPWVGGGVGQYAMVGAHVPDAAFPPPLLLASGFPFRVLHHCAHSPPPYPPPPSRYNPPANKWVRVADMAFPRCYCVAGAVRLERDGKGREQGAGWLGDGGDIGGEGREAGDRLGDGGWERERERGIGREREEERGIGREKEREGERLRDGEGAREGESVVGGERDGERSRVEESERAGENAGVGESSSGGKQGGSSREPRVGKARGAEGGSSSSRAEGVCSVGGAWASERLVVAGGMGASNTSLLTSVEIYHPQEDRWTSAAPLPFECDLEDAAVLANRLLLRHMRCVHSPPGPDAVAFSLSSNSWSPLSGNLPSAWHGPSTVLDSRMYMLDQIGGIRLAVYDDVAQMWRPIGRLSPALLTPPCRILGFRGRLYVIGRGLSMVVVEVEEALRCDGVLLTRRIDGVGCPSDVVQSMVADVLRGGGLGSAARYGELQLVA
ncbi:unnamed protein product [Closterium sp. NIES-65]|nr:unnamed protein product [Closterium sp. NIES-65]